MTIEPAVCFLWALLLLLLPIEWLIAALLSAAFHELCHMTALYAVGKRPDGIHLGLTGCTMDAGDLTPGEVLGCALAGPMGSLFLVSFAKVYPQLAVCAMFHGAYNLLPVYPLDGGRALQAALTLVIPQVWTHKVCCLIKWITVVIFSVALLVSKLQFLFFSGALLVLGRYLAGKIPCKPPKLRVQ